MKTSAPAFWATPWAWLGSQCLAWLDLTADQIPHSFAGYGIEVACLRQVRSEQIDHAIAQPIQ